MKLTKLKVEELKPHPKNVRMHSEKQIDELTKSFKEFGQIRPVVVDTNNTIIVGHGLVEAVKKLGNTEVETLVVELSEAGKKKLMIADNKLYEMGSTDFNALNDLLYELKEDEELSVPGFDDDILKSMFADDEFIDERLGEYGEISEEKAEQLRETKERTEEQIKQAQEEQQGNNEGETEGEEIELDDDVVKVDNSDGDTKPYVECPHCGEKIWL